jgi:hypothetical protein
MTTTPPTAGNDLMELVRSADPLDGSDALEQDDAAHALLHEILAAARPQRRRTARSSMTVVVRIAAVGAAAAVAFVAVAVLTGDNRGEVTPASAAVIRHALGALDQPPGSILHVDMTAVQNNGDGTTVSWQDESWQQNAAPYARRQVETNPDGTISESGGSNEVDQVYDPATDTIYSSALSTTQSSAQEQSRYHLSPGPRAGTLLLRLRVFRIGPDHKVQALPGGPRESLIVSAAQARELKDGTAVIKWVHAPHAAHALNGFRPRVVVVAAAGTAPACDVDPDSAGFSRQMRVLLSSCGAHLVGHATIDGRDTLEIRVQDGHSTYYVDPDSYAPVELDTIGTTGGVDVHFTTWEMLPGTDANDALLRLPAQHPSATVDRNQADYVAAEKRVFPHG